MGLVRKRIGKYEILRITHGKSYADIVPGKGGAVNAISFFIEGNEHQVLDACSTEKELHSNPWFKGAQLFPFPNRVKDGEYTFRGSKHSMPINFPSQHHAIHGFLHDKEMLWRSTKDGVTLARIIDHEQGYPFRLKVTKKYTMTKRGFSCTTFVKNMGVTPAPLGDGWHPYFTLGGEIKYTAIDVETVHEIAQDKRSIPTGKTRQAKSVAGVIGQRRFDTAFGLKKGLNTTALTKNGRRLLVWQDEGYPFVQIYTPPSRTSIAIEPMTCAPDAFNNRKGLIVLKPNTSWTGRYGVKMEKPRR